MFYFIIAGTALLFIGHLVVYLAFVSIFHKFAEKNLKLLRIVFLILTSSFFIAMFFSSKELSFFSGMFYLLSMVWMGFLFYLSIASLIYFFFLFFQKYFFERIPIVLIGKICFVLAIWVGIYGIYHANDLKVTKYDVYLSDLPSSWKGRTAVFLSDMHIGPIRKKEFVKKVSQKIFELNPDIIFDAGDLFDGPKVEASDLISPLARLNPPLGYYFVTGNHEEYGDTNEFKKAISESGMKILSDESIEIQGMQIIGVEYATTTTPLELSTVLEKTIKDEMPSILIKHVPFDLDIAEKYGIDLQLSGHTHRAQMFPLNFITKAIYHGYDYGLNQFAFMKVLVTDGVGTWGPPMRVGTNSEIVLITFK